MLGGRAGEIVSRRETPSQCGRVGSPANVVKAVAYFVIRLRIQTMWPSIEFLSFSPP